MFNRLAKLLTSIPTPTPTGGDVWFTSAAFETSSEIDGTELGAMLMEQTVDYVLHKNRIHGSITVHFQNQTNISWGIWVDPKEGTEVGLYDHDAWKDLVDWYKDTTRTEPFYMKIKPQNYATMFYREDVIQIEVEEKPSET